MSFLQDVKFGVRMLAKNPLFAIMAVLTLALGIGVNSTVFTLANAVLFKGLPFENPHEIMAMNLRNKVRGQGSIPFSYLDFLEYQKQSKTMTGIAGYSNLAFDISDDDRPAERVPGSALSSNFFSVLGRQPILGRDFTPDDDRAAAEPVVLISYGLWQTRYGGDPGIVGKTIKANLKHYTIIGIMPKDERFPNNTSVWASLAPTRVNDKRNDFFVQAVGRIAPGRSLTEAQAEFKTISQGLEQAYPDSNKDLEADAMTFVERANGEVRPIFYTALGAVGFVLLIACANVANLMLSRAITRTREASIRTALGASRWRVVRQLLVESVILSLLGGGLGLALAVFGARLFDNAVSDVGKPYWIDFSMDYTVVGYTIAICAATGVLFGIFPALQMSKVNVNDSLKDGGRGSSGGVRSRRFTGILLIGEFALTIVLLVGAGLMIRSFLQANRFEVGVRTDNMLTALIPLRPEKFPQAADKVRFQERLVEQIRNLPGIDAVTTASTTPGNGTVRRRLKLQDRDIADSNNEYPMVNTLIVAPGYFQALELTLKRGREFSPSDGASGTEAVIVNESFAAKFWPGEDSLGKRIRLGDDDNSAWLAVVGVCPPILQSNGGPGSPDFESNVIPAAVYLPYRQNPSNFAIMVRSRLQRESLTSSLRTELRNIDADIPLYDIRTLDERLRQRSWPYRVFGSLFSVFAVLALVMSSVGIYAVTAYGVNQRTQEIGVRIALGASQTSVLWLVLRQGLFRITIGLVLGLAGAYGLSRVLGSFLFQVTPTDPVTFVSISILLTLITIVACLIPAKRAMRLDPVDALRTE